MTLESKLEERRWEQEEKAWYANAVDDVGFLTTDESFKSQPIVIWVIFLPIIISH